IEMNYLVPDTIHFMGTIDALLEDSARGFIQQANTERMSNRRRSGRGIAGLLLTMVSTVPVMIPLTVRRRLQPRPRALAQWNKALETSPKSAAAHYNLFDLYSTKLMYDNAVAQLEQALGKSTRGECCGCQLQACWVPGIIAGKMDSHPCAVGV